MLEEMGRSEIQDPIGRRYWLFFQGRDVARVQMQWTMEGGCSEEESRKPYGNTPISRRVNQIDDGLCVDLSRSLTSSESQCCCTI